jgi:hypothetical protein
MYIFLARNSFRPEHDREQLWNDSQPGARVGLSFSRIRLYSMPGRGRNTLKCVAL